MSSIILLRNKEIELFDSPSEMSDDERHTFFTLDGIDDFELRKPQTKVGYILQRGYFLFQKRFFIPSQFRDEDILFVSELCSYKQKVDVNDYKKAIYVHHRQSILKSCGYTSFSDSLDLFNIEALALVRTPSNPQQIFYSLLEFLDEKKIEIPKYYVFSNTITFAIKSFGNDLIKVMEYSLSEPQQEFLDDIMSLPSSDQEISTKHPYLITQLKRVIQSTNPQSIKKSLEEFYIIRDLHSHFQDFLTSNIVSDELLNYYAVWVLKAKHIQFESISKLQEKRLYTIAFIAYQYKIRQDYFVDIFLQAIQKYYQSVDKAIADNFINKNIKPQKQTQIAKVKRYIALYDKQKEKLKQIFKSSQYTGDEKVSLAMAELFSKEKEEIISSQIIHELDKLENLGTKALKTEMFFQELDSGYRKIHNRIAGILLILDFNINTSNAYIMDAVLFYQSSKGKITNKAPVAFIPKNELKWIYKNKEFNANMYKILLFKSVANHIKAGSLNLAFSERYKSIDDYLINQERWNRDKEALMERANIKHLLDKEETLSHLKQHLDENYRKTNLNIAENKYLKFDKNGVPKITTPKLEDTEHHLISEIIGTDHYLPLAKILAEINHSTDFSSSFSHYSIKSNNKPPENNIIYAAIIALGCNIGVCKMGRISSDIGADKLDYAVKWFFSKENIDDANQKILTLTGQLALPNIFLENEDKLYTSSDGQKYDVSVPAINATYSFKYFGTGKGISAYSFIDEKSRLFYNTVLSASEREAGYVLDGLLHNDEIESDMHSTDTHGYTEIIFGICNSLGVLFAPRIKNMSKQLLYTFRGHSAKDYESPDYRILPSKNMYINEKVIYEQWENVLRLLCSIKLKETMPSNILKRLSSYSKQHPLYKAIKEIGRIHKSIFLLRYYHELQLRQSIEKQLNSVELSHLFAKAVFFGNNQEFKYEIKQEQELALACRHLIQNAIILWNYLYVSEKLAHIEDSEKIKNIINSSKNSSIITWQHVNMHGEYDFKNVENQSAFDVNKIVGWKFE